MGVTFDDLTQNARYDFLGVVVEGASIRARFRRNAAGIRGFLMGLLSRRQYLMETEGACFEFAKRFGAITPSLLTHSDSAYAFREGGAAIQSRKLQLGIPLDCAQDSSLATASSTSS